MSRLAYVNGAFVLREHAMVPMEDRGYHFADGAYEVFSYNTNQVFVDAYPHLERLRRSLRELHIPCPWTDKTLLMLMHELMRRNGCLEGFLYMQVTRGVAPRDHTLSWDPEPFLTMFVRDHVFKHTPPLFKVFIEPDIRWQRNDIKSIALLGNVMSKYNAERRGGHEAWLLNEEGVITEGSSTNAWIITKEGVIRTHPATSDILNGVVRQRILRIIKELDLPVEEKAFTRTESLEAAEAFLTSSTKGVYPIVSIDDNPVGKGAMGPLTEKIHKAYWIFQNSLMDEDADHG